MIINTNVSSLKINNLLTTAQSEVNTAIERLSSGNRINGAQDDAAGLAITERFNTQVNGNNQAMKNVEDGKSLLQTADGASLNAELVELKKEIDHIANQTNFNGITLLNEGSLQGVTQEVLDNLEAQIPHWIDDGIKKVQETLGIDALPTGITINVEYYYDSSSGTRASMGGVPGSSNYTLKVNLGRLLDTNNEIPGGTGTYPDAISGGDFDNVIAHELVHNIQFTKFPGLSFGGDEMWFIEGLASAVQGRNTYFNMNYADRANAYVNPTAWNGDYEASFAAIKTLHEITTGGIQAFIDRLEAGDTLDEAFANTTQSDALEFAAINTGDGTGAIDFTTMSQFLNWFNTSTEVDQYLKTSTDFTAGEGSLGLTQGVSNFANKEGVVVNNTTIETGPNNGGIYTLVFKDIQGKPIQIHASSAATDIVEIDKADLTTTGLGVDGGDILSATSAEAFIASLDAALEKVAAARSNFGAMSNRLDFMINNLSTSVVNTSSSRSRIEDADMAEESSRLAKSEILTQTTMAMLSKSNQSKESILTLLK